MRILILAALLLPLAAQAHPGKGKHAKRIALVGRAVGHAAAPVIVPLKAAPVVSLSGQAKAQGGAR